MTTLGTNIRLKGITQKGKNRVRENGETWTVLAITDHVLFNKGKQGPWLYIVPEGKEYDDRAGRWVHGLDDADFVVVGLNS